MFQVGPDSPVVTVEVLQTEMFGEGEADLSFSLRMIPLCAAAGGRKLTRGLKMTRRWI